MQKRPQSRTPEQELANGNHSQAGTGQAPSSTYHICEVFLV